MQTIKIRSISNHESQSQSFLFFELWKPAGTVKPFHSLNAQGKNGESAFSFQNEGF